jgi:hypothetical protein
MATSRVTGVADTVKVLSKLNKEIVNKARSDLRTGAQPVANAIKSNIPTEAPLRGMIHNGRTRWQPAGISAKVKTNFSKKAQRNETSLVSIVVGAKGKNSTGAASFQIADMAGRKAKGKTRSGKAMINKLNSIARASRYVYPAAEREIPYIINQVEGTIEGLSTSLNNELKRVR